MTPLRARSLSLAYSRDPIISELDVAFPDNEFTAIVGPNACGKSTLLRGLVRLMPLQHGTVLLNGHDIATRPSVDIARELGFLPQQQVMPAGLTVADLVSRGRFPYRSFLRRWSPDDDAAVTTALSLAGIADLAERRVDELSGGQRQRVWLATVLAQDPRVILLDEPTTYLDLTHQLEILDVLAELPTRGYTVVAVLHDLNLAARYATNMIALSHGRIVAQGRPAEVITETLMSEVFHVDCRIIPDPETGTPLVVPRARKRSA